MSVFVPKSHLEGLEWLFSFNLSKANGGRLRTSKRNNCINGHLVTHASDTIPYYNKRLKEAGLDFKGKITEKQWESIPLLRREDI